MSGELRVCLTGNKKGNTFNKTDFAVSMVFIAGSQTQTVKFCLTHTPQQHLWLSLSSWLTLKPPWMAQSFEPDPAQDFSLFKVSFSSSLLKTVSRLWLATDMQLYWTERNEQHVLKVFWVFSILIAQSCRRTRLLVLPLATCSASAAWIRLPEWNTKTCLFFFPTLEILMTSW